MWMLYLGELRGSSAEREGVCGSIMVLHYCCSCCQVVLLLLVSAAIVLM